MSVFVHWTFILSVLSAAVISLNTDCGGYFSERYGVIATPDFPHRFQVPIKCKWIINATQYHSHGNFNIFVYFTQFFVLKGFRFLEYVHYEETGKPYGKTEYNLEKNNDSALLTHLISDRPYVVIEFNIDSLSHAHFRVANVFTDVYGFNITYEIQKSSLKPRKDACTVGTCSLVGNCVASWNFTRYYCQCIHGFFGKYCQFGPNCDLEHGINFCKNGGICRYYGYTSMFCTCPVGYTGDRCNVKKPVLPKGCLGQSSDCYKNCYVDDDGWENCRCALGYKMAEDGKRCIQTDIALFNISIKLNDSRIENLTETQVMYLVTKPLEDYWKSKVSGDISNFTIVHVSPSYEVRLCFFGERSDHNNIWNALFKSPNKGKKIGFGISNTYGQFDMKPALQLKEVITNQPPPLRENQDFAVTCVASGSPRIHFTWYKDEMLINVSQVLRPRFMKEVVEKSHDEYTAQLIIMTATDLDKGIYTCEVTDWGDQLQSKSIYIDVLSPPSVEVLPKSLTLNKSEDKYITCVSYSGVQPIDIGYNWVKNNKLLIEREDQEVVDDLKPFGSMLKIMNAQKSATYSCIVTNKAGESKHSVRVEVIDPKTIGVCSETGELYGLVWPRTATNLEAIQSCPRGFQGVARRKCLLINRPVWDEVNFSDCADLKLVDINIAFQNLKLGYQATDVKTVLHNISVLLDSRGKIYPGEGEFILNLVSDVKLYLDVKQMYREFHAVAHIYCDIMSQLLNNTSAIRSREKVFQLQQQIEQYAMTTASLLAVGKNRLEKCGPVIIDTAKVKSVGPYSFDYPRILIRYPQWFTDHVSLKFNSSQVTPSENGTISLSVVVYNNFRDFLPKRYVAKLNEFLDVEYEMRSRIISVSMEKNQQALGLNHGSVMVTLTFHYMNHSHEERVWNITCGRANFTHTKAQWTLDACSTEIQENFTKCECDNLGTYAVFIAYYDLPQKNSKDVNYHIVVGTGCLVCLVFTSMTGCLLTLHYWKCRTTILLLKIQVCLSVMGAKITFLAAVRDSLEVDVYPYFLSVLEVLLLIGLSSQLAKGILLYAESVDVYEIRNVNYYVHLISLGVPVLATCAIMAAQSMEGWELSSWWLKIGTMHFTGFVVTAGCLVVLYFLLYSVVWTELRRKINMDTSKRKIFQKRLGLLWRSAIVLVTVALLDTASILYINIPDELYHYIFAIASALLGIILFFCYTVKSESRVPIPLLSQFDICKGDDIFDIETKASSMSRSTLLDVTSAARGSHLMNHHHHHPSTKHAHMKKVPMAAKRCTAENEELLSGSSMVTQSSGGSIIAPASYFSTKETYIPSPQESVEMKILSSNVESSDKNADIIPNNDSLSLEKYDMSPKKYPAKTALAEIQITPENDVITDTDMSTTQPYVVKPAESYTHPNSTPLVKPSPVRSYIKDPSEIPKPKRGKCYIKDSPEIIIKAQIETIPEVECSEEGDIQLVSKPEISQKASDISDYVPPDKGLRDYISMPAEDKKQVYVNVPGRDVGKGVFLASHSMKLDREKLLFHSIPNSPQKVGSSNTGLFDQPGINGNASNAQSQSSCSSLPCVTAAECVLDLKEDQECAANEKSKCSDGADGVLGRIANDLNYLLNRTSQHGKGVQTLSKKKSTSIPKNKREDYKTNSIQSSNEDQTLLEVSTSEKTNS